MENSNTKNNKINFIAGDLDHAYEILGEVRYDIVAYASTNRQSAAYEKLSEKYKDAIEATVASNFDNFYRDAFSRHYTTSKLNKEHEIDKAIFMAAKELEEKALSVSANAIIHLKQKVVFYYTRPNYAEIILTGTVVRLK